MPRFLIFSLFFVAVFLQAGTYGLTFMLPKLFAGMGANEKIVGQMLVVTAVATILAVYYAGHFSDWFGRTMTLALACVAIALSLVLYGIADVIGY